MPSTTMSERDTYLAGFEREYETTLKLLRSYPAGQSELRPAEKCKNARELAYVLAMGQAVVGLVATASELTSPPAFQAPSAWAEVMGAFEKAHADSRVMLGKMSEADFNAPFTILTGPGGQTTRVRRADALWLFAMDQVHHRGQFSVYARMAGARVPSIYGPSGDEPWA